MPFPFSKYSIKKSLLQAQDLGVDGFAPPYEAMDLPPAPVFDSTLQSGGRSSYPDSVSQLLPAGKTLTANDQLSTDFFSTTEEEVRQKWDYNDTWAGVFPGVFVDDNVQLGDTSIHMKVEIMEGPMPDDLRAKFPGLDENDHSDVPYYYPTSFIRTRQTMTHGYTEICCKLSASAVTSSFWLKELDKSKREIDVFEYTTGTQTDSGATLGQTHTMSVHQFNNNEDDVAQTQIGFKTNLSNERYFFAGMLWTDTMIFFFVNDVCVRQLTHNYIFDSTCQMHVQFDREVFAWVNKPGTDDPMDDFDVYYVRTWDLVDITTAPSAGTHPQQKILGVTREDL